MGTYRRSTALAIVVILLGLSALAWAAAEAEPAAPAPAVASDAEPPAEELAPAPAEEEPALAVEVAKREGAEATAPASDPPAEAIEELGVCENARGIVYFYDDGQWEVWANIGARHGLRPTARVVFLRDGEVIGEGRVVDVRNADCVIRPDKDIPAGALLIGDDVRVVQNGSRAALDRVIAKDRWERQILSLLVYAGLAYAIDAAGDR